MQFKILIVGAGQLGSRYLQGLAESSRPLSIYVIDINQDSLSVAKERWEQTADANRLYDIHFSKNLEEIPRQIDLAIISTGSNVRQKIIAAVKENAQVDNWILEKVLAQSSESVDDIVKAIGAQSKAWVNTFFRTVDWFKEIRENAAEGNIELVVTGGNWGIACNTIHFIDFIEWWTNEQVVEFDNSGLDSSWFPAKRPGFWEVNGILVAKFSGGSTATFISDDTIDPFEIKIKTITEEWIIEWDKGIASRNDRFRLHGKIPFQSQMTNNLVENILTRGLVELPALDVSANQHKPFLDSLLEHWNVSKSEKLKLVPIT